ncbi:MAG: phosphoribosylformylglycinamidine synthase, partial [Clostridia bacterium]|nr:phosphoribosylformylglycinamidine synthase [Clostridia bacterium]
MVYRIFVEKRKGLENEARALYSELTGLLGISRLTGVRLLNRYDVEGITEEVFSRAVGTVFSEPQLDLVYGECPAAAHVLAVEYLPGQFDQRADSAAQCIQLLAQVERPTIRTARVYLLEGALTDSDLEAIAKYIINPVEARRASLQKPATLAVQYEVPTEVETLSGFTALTEEGLAAFLTRYGLAMDLDDVRFCRDYFKNEEGRDPTLTEIRMIDTYWSDHCRHTTFLTTIDDVTFEDETLAAAWADYLAVREGLGRKKPKNLMDVATLAVKQLRKDGKLDKLDESEEINACTVKIDVTVDGVTEPWLLLFKNETHNHPTEIEPFGGAATCIGGAIRDPLSGRSYVYAAMRVTGAADPTRPMEETLEGKLPQRKIVSTAA